MPEKQYMDITITKATEKDFPDILEMIKELAEYEKAPEKVTNNLQKMQEEKHLFQAFIARKDDRPVGFALFFFAYFTWTGKSLYLDDIYVRQEYRKQGIGKKLITEVINFAKENNCSRIRWQVLNWNTPAIEFYKKLGATISDEWLNCEIDLNR